MITTPLVPWTASQRTVLNPWLYNRLTELFGEVKLANAGKPFEGREQIVNGKKRIEAVEHGEQYRVNCPFCGDKRFRLSINHRYADYRWLANCFNDACLKDKQNRGILQIRILGTEFQHLGVPNSVLTGSGGGSIVLALPPAPALPVVVRADRHISFDGNVQSVSQLAVDHPARCYIQSRGFDVDRLSAEYKVAFCHDAWADDVLAVRRLTIPYYSDGFLVGWIARRIDGVQPGCFAECKYVTRKGFSKSRFLYNLDQARQYRTIVVCEGPTDVWRVGPCAVAVLGKVLSTAQQTLLDLYCRLGDRSLVLMLDGDVDLTKINLPDYRRRFPGRFVAVHLPDKKDPADFTHNEITTIIRAQAAEQGVDPNKVDLPAPLV